VYKIDHFLGAITTYSFQRTCIRIQTLADTQQSIVVIGLALKIIALSKRMPASTMAAIAAAGYLRAVHLSNLTPSSSNVLALCCSRTSRTESMCFSISNQTLVAETFEPVSWMLSHNLPVSRVTHSRDRSVIVYVQVASRNPHSFHPERSIIRLPRFIDLYNSTACTLIDRGHRCRHPVCLQKSLIPSSYCERHSSSSVVNGLCDVKEKPCPSSSTPHGGARALAD
jgi:hypothetical protein